MEGMESNPRAALGLKPTYGEQGELSPHLISDDHCKAVNVNLERRKTTKEKTERQESPEGAYWGLWRGTAPAFSQVEGVSWQQKAPCERLHGALCRMQGCGWVPKGVCFVAVNTVP